MMNLQNLNEIYKLRCFHKQHRSFDAAPFLVWWQKVKLFFGAFFRDQAVRVITRKKFKLFGFFAQENFIRLMGGQRNRNGEE